jgi:hypothetical protein
MLLIICHPSQYLTQAAGKTKRYLCNFYSNNLRINEFKEDYKEGKISLNQLHEKIKTRSTKQIQSYLFKRGIKAPGKRNKNNSEKIIKKNVTNFF